MSTNQQIQPIKELEVNISKTERVVSLISGSLMLYNALKKKPVNIPQSILSGFMIFRGVSGHCPAYSLAGKNLEEKKPQNINIKVTMDIDKPVSEVYHFWRKLENLPVFMKHLESVTVIDHITSEWKAKIPGNLATIKWKAAILKDEPNKELSWSSYGEALIHNVGKINFRENDDLTTRLDVVISYTAPLEHAGESVAKVLNPIFENMVENDIKRFKEFMEMDYKALI